nr:MAG: hypothetical protein 1 [Leviviridae sp.]
MIKHRVTGHIPNLVGYKYFYENDPRYRVETPIVSLTDKTEETLFTIGNYCWQDPKGRNIGGPFGLIRTSVKKDGLDAYLRRGSAYSYRGKVLAKLSNTYSMPSTWADPSPFGPELYSRMKPAEPKFEALNALYELREVPNMLRQRFSPDIRGASNYWLALQFGWKPLLSDIRNLINTQRVAENYIKQLLRDNGKPVRRTAKMEVSSSTNRTVSTSYANIEDIGVTQLHASMHQRIETLSVTDNVWASARFRYWLPGGPRDINWTRSMLARIYGLHPRPSVVYNAVPWTWLIDWFTNIGAIVDNMSAGVADRLAADYFYVMREKRETLVSEVTGRLYFDNVPRTFSVSSTAERVTKARTVGSPFGVSILESELSPMQLSILGALGGSRT